MILFAYCLRVWECNGVFSFLAKHILNNFYRKSDEKIVAISADGFEQLKQSENIGKWIAFVQMWMVCTCFIQTWLNFNKSVGNDCFWATMHSIARMPTMRIIDFLFSHDCCQSENHSNSNLCGTPMHVTHAHVRLKLLLRPDYRYIHILFFHSRYLFRIYSFRDLFWLSFSVRWLSPLVIYYYVLFCYKREDERQIQIIYYIAFSYLFSFSVQKSFIQMVAVIGRRNGQWFLPILRPFKLMAWLKLAPCAIRIWIWN